ncbi:MAG: hypothetical protein MRY79_07265 [Alphaproteobacteria bacterium]|nr:hypothetical protein [Alphaproteobacteria bacterium]
MSQTNVKPSDVTGEQEAPDESPVSGQESPVGRLVTLNADIKVDCDAPLPHLDKGGVKAYRAVGSAKIENEIFALICDKSLIPRTIGSIKYANILNPNMAKLIAAGKILWPDTKEERYCFIYQDSLGKPIFAGNNPVAMGLNPDLVMENIVSPMIHILMDMRDKDFVHGEIWPGNMFDGGSSGYKKIRLGECLSAPASYYLPALYEPIERALADPIAKGLGTCADDLYSFGVSLAVMMRTTDWAEGLSDEQIIERKLEKGSYSTLIGKDRFSGAVLELLRGLLYDDPEQRWTLDDVQAWMDGRRLSPKQSAKRVKATRPLILGDKKYTRPELLAKDVTKNPDDTLRIIENSDLQLWIERAIEDKVVKSRVEQAIEDSKSFEKNAGYAERTACAVATALYPQCPVRYKGVIFTPDGFGKLLSRAYITKQDMQAFVDILRHTFVMDAIRGRAGTDTVALISKFDSCRAFLNQQTLHMGLERCIYFLDNECYCLSPILDKFYVRTPEEMVDAFESLCASSKPDILFDRHVISFLSVKDRQNIDPYIPDLGASEPFKRLLGQLRVLATLQKRSSLPSYPAIAGWFERNMEPVYERLHDRKKRDRLKMKMERLARAGDLTKIAILFDDPKLFEGDVIDFYQAMEQYRTLEEERGLIEKNLENKKNYGQRTGVQMASVVSMVLAALIILGMAYRYFLMG